MKTPTIYLSRLSNEELEEFKRSLDTLRKLQNGVVVDNAVLQEPANCIRRCIIKLRGAELRLPELYFAFDHFGEEGKRILQLIGDNASRLYLRILSPNSSEAWSQLTVDAIVELSFGLAIANERGGRTTIHNKIAAQDYNGLTPARAYPA